MTRIDRRTVLRATGSAIAATAATSGTTAGHQVSTSLYTTADLSVRSGPGLDHGRIAVATEGTGGHVVDGPVDADGYTWWEIAYNGDGNNGRVTGWSVQQYTTHADFSYPATGVVSQEYQSGHLALDVANANDPTYLHAAADGTVAFVDAVDDSPCGHFVILDHGGGWETLYCHMDQIFVSTGETVARDEHIGTMGDTGRSTGQHVHFAIEHDDVHQPVPGFAGQELQSKAGVPRNYR